MEETRSGWPSLKNEISDIILQFSVCSLAIRLQVIQKSLNNKGFCIIFNTNGFCFLSKTALTR